VTASRFAGSVEQSFSFFGRPVRINPLRQRSIVLFGIGHTNAHIVREWAMNPVPDCRLVCVSKFPTATYSGMLPGTLAGQFSEKEMQIDLTRLTQQCGAQLILDEVTGIDWAQQTLHFASTTSVTFDVISIGVGSVPAGLTGVQSGSLIATKPMQTFLQRLEARLAVVYPRAGRNMNLVIVGGGVASVEIALCLLPRLRFEFPHVSVKLRLVTAGEEIVPELSPRSAFRIKKILADRGVEVLTNSRVTTVDDSSITVSDGRQLSAEGVIWATGATAPPVLSRLGLPVDERGFIQTHRTLQTTADLPAFAVGDCGSIVGSPTPKAGVYAVRQAPVLWHNLRAYLTNAAMQEFHPQGEFLKLINTGDGKALLQYSSLSIHARWCWTLKTWIDRRFLRPFQV